MAKTKTKNIWNFSLFLTYYFHLESIYTEVIMIIYKIWEGLLKYTDENIV